MSRVEDEQAAAAEPGEEEEDGDHEEEDEEKDGEKDGEDEEKDGEDEDMDDDEEDDKPAPAAIDKKGRGRPAKGVAKDGGAMKEKGERTASVQSRSGLTFPIHRFAKQLKRGGYAKRIAVAGSVYLTSVIEYVTAEILELAGNAAKDQKKNRIIPRHIQLAIRSDEELNKYMQNVTICGGGVIPNIHSVLLPRKVGVDKDADTAPMSQEF